MLFEPSRSEENKKNSRRARVLFGKTTPRWGGRYTWLNEEPDAVQDHFAKLPPGSIPRKRPEGFDPIKIASFNLDGAVTKNNPGIDPDPFSSPGMLGNGFLGMPPNQPQPSSPENTQPDEQQPKHPLMPNHPDRDTSRAIPLPYHPEKDRTEIRPNVLRGNNPGSDPDNQLFSSNQTNDGTATPGVDDQNPTRMVQTATEDQNTNQPPSAQIEEEEETKSSTRTDTDETRQKARSRGRMSAADRLRNLAENGRLIGFEHSPAALEHFLNGKGEDLVLTPKKARERAPARKGKEINQKHFEEKIVLDRSNSTGDQDGGPSPYNYYPDLINLKDGDTIHLLGKPTKDNPTPQADYYNSNHGFRLQRFGGGGVDEYFATGNSTVTSTVWNGLTAQRDGDRLTIKGVVSHEWSDV